MDPIQEQQLIDRAVERFKYQYPDRLITNLKTGSGRVMVEGDNGEKVEM